MHMQLHFHTKIEIFMGSTHSNLKYFPVVTQYMSFPHFVAIKHHCTKHTSDISRTFPTEPLTILDFPATPSTSIVAKCVVMNADVLDFICTSAFSIFFLQSSISLTKWCSSHQSFLYQVLIMSSNHLPFSSPNHMLSLFSFLCLAFSRFWQPSLLIPKHMANL